MWRLVSASEQTQLLQLLEHVPDNCSFLLMLPMSMQQWLSLLVKQEEEIPCSHPSTVSQGDPGRVVSCFAREVFTLSSQIFSHSSSVWPTIQYKTENFPYTCGQRTQNKIYQMQGKEVKFLFFITFIPVTLRCAAAFLSPLPAFSAAPQGQLLT